ncbi:potassium channel family protein [Planctomicrobium sp.]|nr:potassium channel family protein [Planctomicrobium sp.]MDB4731242.1 potassium channel family protein [bacterium]MDB4733291.1 potassium channel family protein [Planctomicrobium sp.]
MTLSRLNRKKQSRQRWRINILILGALATHVVEMSLFSLGYALLCRNDWCGHIQDAAGEASTDYFYFSFVVFTSLGFGDLTPVGSIRMMTALETLTGLVLIGWTASFLFVEMQHWAENNLAE